LDHPDIQSMSILDILRDFRRLTLARSDEPQILFLDEVHMRDGFEIELKMISDLEPSTLVVASGSSSLVIRHRSGAMTGRYSKIEIDPLDFREYLRFRGFEFDPSQPALMEGMMDEYLIDGGMPAYILKREPTLILDVVDDIIYKDILTRYPVQDPKAVKDLFFLLMNRVGKPLSYSKIAHVMQLGIDTIKRYIAYFEESYLVHIVERDGKPNERKYTPRKIYAPDNGIVVIASGSKDIGPLAENAVYLALRKKGEVRYIEKKGKEIDFTVGSRTYEVKYRDSVEEEDLHRMAEAIPKNRPRLTLITRRSIAIPERIDNIALWEILGSNG